MNAAKKSASQGKWAKKFEKSGNNHEESAQKAAAKRAKSKDDSAVNYR